RAQLIPVALLLQPAFRASELVCGNDLAGVLIDGGEELACTLACAVILGRCEITIASDFSGIVGNEVADLHPGDEVYGFLAFSSGTKQGAFAERIVVDRATVATKPASIGHDGAAAAATPAISAIQALRDKGHLPANGRVLVIGAAGGVGSMAIGV